MFYFILFFGLFEAKREAERGDEEDEEEEKKRIRADADPVRVSRVRTVISTKPLPTVHTQLSLETVSDSVCAARRGGKQKRVRIGPCFVARRVDFFTKSETVQRMKTGHPHGKIKSFFLAFFGGGSLAKFLPPTPPPCSPYSRVVSFVFF